MPFVRSLRGGDASRLLAFYNGLSPGSLRTFRPLGSITSLDVCESIARENAGPQPSRVDFIAVEQEAMVGWSFISQLTGEHPNLGIGVADSMQGRGVGTALMTQTLAKARELGLAVIYLMVVQDNSRAMTWYERCGFVKYAEEFDEHDQLPYFHMRARLRE